MAGLGGVMGWGDVVVGDNKRENSNNNNKKTTLQLKAEFCADRDLFILEMYYSVCSLTSFDCFCSFAFHFFQFFCLFCFETGSGYIAQAVLKLKILPTQCFKCWDFRRVSPHGFAGVCHPMDRQGCVTTWICRGVSSHGFAGVCHHISPSFSQFHQKEENSFHFLI